jgi:hypothetical protein
MRSLLGLSITPVVLALAWLLSTYDARGQSVQGPLRMGPPRALNEQEACEQVQQSGLKCRGHYLSNGFVREWHAQNSFFTAEILVREDVAAFCQGKPLTEWSICFELRKNR